MHESKKGTRRSQRVCAEVDWEKEKHSEKNEHNNIKRQHLSCWNGCFLLCPAHHRVRKVKQFTFPQQCSSWEHVQHLTDKLMNVIVRVPLYIFCHGVPTNQIDSRPLSMSGRDQRCLSGDRIDRQLAGMLV